MGALLRVDFIKMFKSKVFWIALVLNQLVLIYTLYDFKKFLRYDFGGLFIIGAIESAFVVVATVPFIAGADFAGGMIRNKITRGYKRYKVYLSNTIVSIVFAAIVWVQDLVSYLIRMLMVSGNETFKLLSDSKVASWNVKVALLVLLLYMAFSVLSCAATMVTGKKIIAVFVAIIMFFISIGMIASRYYATETSDTMYYTDSNGEIVEEPNIYFLPYGSPQRAFFTVVDAMNYPVELLMPPVLWGRFGSADFFMPAEYELGWFEEKYTVEVPARYMAGCFASMVVTGLIGALVFNKRNLK